ncbi:putative pyridoxal phosphate-dependent aminotransferase EpsN [mine drainage metagenome]|uniref:Putative pyridoxal phosphate-dependent aminotransferase EpsN n=1 Tax=mine drainage metagenome TaxID=410659 RepID=A0A1J5QN85_9ZZZZ
MATTSKLPQIDLKGWFQDVSAQFRGLNPNDPGAWPKWPRYTVYAVALLLTVALGWYLWLSGTKEELTSAQQQELTLRDDYKRKLEQAVSLDLLKAQKAQVQQYVVLLEKQLPSKAEMDALLPLLEDAGVPVLEDAAESLGATYRGRPSGSFGRLAVFSFNGNKIITTSGGGMLAGRDGDLIAHARKLSTQAREPARHYEHVEDGYNYRLSNVLAGIGRGQLRVLEQRVQSRRAVHARYREALAGMDGVRWMEEPQGHRSTRWLSAFTLDLPDASARRDALLDFLERHNVEARPVWKPMHLQPLYAGCRYFTHAPEQDVSAALFAGGICLPSGSNMTAAQLDRVCELLARGLELAADAAA